MTTLADTARRLDIAWQHSLRRDPPRQRWAAQHPSLSGDPHDLRQRLTSRDEASREPLRALVELATAGDNTAAMLVTLALLPRMVAVERRRRNPSRNGESYAAATNRSPERCGKRSSPPRTRNDAGCAKTSNAAPGEGCTAGTPAAPNATTSTQTAPLSPLRLTSAPTSPAASRSKGHSTG